MSFRDRVLAVGGRGQLRGKLLNLMPVMSRSGPEYDVGQLVTYVNDACMVAPSMLLTSGVTWTGVDDNSFDLTLVDRGNTVTARVFVDDDGHLVDFSTTDPYFTSPKGLQQARWTTPADGWTWSPWAARCRGVRGPSGICGWQLLPWAGSGLRGARVQRGAADNTGRLGERWIAVIATG
jgi:hypothetical protein